MTTNDPVNPKHTLVMTGPVDRFVTITPSRVVLRGEAGSPIRASATIVPEKRYPFKILDIKARNDGNFRYDLTPRQDGSGGYLLEVENLRTLPGRYHAAIELITDSRIRPRIDIAVYGHIRKAAEKQN